jgi:hypothetical protein
MSVLEKMKSKQNPITQGEMPPRSKRFGVLTLPTPAVLPHPPDPPIASQSISRDAPFREKAAASEWARRTLFPPAHPPPVGTGAFPVRTPQTLSAARTLLETVFNVLEIKNPQGLRQTLRIAPASFILACSPALEGTMLNVPGRSSGSWFVLLPAPSHPCTGQWRWRVSSPLTAAGPRGIRTLFPYPKITM